MCAPSFSLYSLITKNECLAKVCTKQNIKTTAVKVQAKVYPTSWPSRRGRLPPHIEVDFLLGLGYQAMDLFHILPLNRNKIETVEEDRGENCHLKVGELVARALPRAVCAKGTELSSPASVGATGGKMVCVKPMQREKEGGGE